MEPDTIRRALTDAGCTEQTGSDLLELYLERDFDTVIAKLKKVRCLMIQEMHESGRKVDRIDYLIQKAEGEQRSGGVMK